MCNITLIATIHLENEKCNPDELHKILEEIKPDVIFEESTIPFSEMYYSDSFDSFCVSSILQNRPHPVVPLEVKAIKRYRQDHDVEIVPVDIDVRQELAMHQDKIFSLFSMIFENEDYKKIESERDIHIAQKGFNYLNSSEFLDFLEKKTIVEKRVIESHIQRNNLINTYKLFYEINCDNRESVMLEKIYNYSKENQYNQAVFLVGAEHKRSMIPKITERQKMSSIKLNWKMYGDK